MIKLIHLMENILSDITISETPIWKTVIRDKITSEHNFDNNEVNTILKKLNNIKTNNNGSF